MKLSLIQPGDRVQILVHAGGIGRSTEWKPKWGRAVMLGPSGWVLNMGGQYGTPGIADENNITSVPRLKFKWAISRPTHWDFDVA